MCYAAQWRRELLSTTPLLPTDHSVQKSVRDCCAKHEPPAELLRCLLDIGSPRKVRKDYPKNKKIFQNSPKIDSAESFARVCPEKWGAADPPNHEVADFWIRCGKSPCFRIMLPERNVDGKRGVFLRQQRCVRIHTTDSRRKPADTWPPSIIKSSEPMMVFKHFLAAAHRTGVSVPTLSRTSIRSCYWMTCVG